MARVLVTEEIAEAGLGRLRAAGHEVDVRLGLDDEGLVEALQGASALIIRSATRVTAEVLDAVDGLLVVGRAGIGRDTVDVRAANVVRALEAELSFFSDRFGFQPADELPPLAIRR